MVWQPDSTVALVERQAILRRLAEQGKCGGMTDLFYPSQEEARPSERRAQRICRTCDVRADCLSYSIEYEERYGIWGGYGERARSRIARQVRSGRMTIEDACDDY